MIEMEKPRIECVEVSEDGSYGKFVVEPLERGYATTLGNSLRRILLSSLPTNFQQFPVLPRMLQRLYLTSKNLQLSFMQTVPRQSTSTTKAQARFVPAT